MSKPLCIHCRKHPGSYGLRGLCVRCRRTTEIAALYPPRSQWAPGLAAPTKPAFEPCPFPPGTIEHSIVLQQRLANEQHIRHPHDAFFDGDGALHYFEGGAWHIDPHAELVPGAWQKDTAPSVLRRGNLRAATLVA